MKKECFLFTLDYGGNHENVFLRIKFLTLELSNFIQQHKYTQQNDRKCYCEEEKINKEVRLIFRFYNRQPLGRNQSVENESIWVSPATLSRSLMLFKAPTYQIVDCAHPNDCTVSQVSSW